MISVLFEVHLNFFRKKGRSLVTCSEELIFRNGADLQQCYLEVVLAEVHIVTVGVCTGTLKLL